MSRAWVSRGLNDSERVPAATREKIRAAAKRMGYTEDSNRDARSLIARRYGRQMRHDILAVVFSAQAEGKPLPSEPFYAPLLLGLESEASRREVDLFLCPLGARALPRLIRAGNVDGVVFMGHAELIPEVQSLSLPVVALNLFVPGIPSILTVDAPGTGQAMRHLLELGHRRIAYLGFHLYPGFEAAHERFGGYCAALEAAGLTVEPSLTETSLHNPNIDSGYEGMARLLEKNRIAGARPPFTGLVCHNDLIAMGAIRRLEEAGWHVPGDVSVVGFDDVSMQHGFRPALTSVGFDRQAMGRYAVEVLCGLVERSTDEPSLAPEQRFPLELVIRDSTAPLAR